MSGLMFGASAFALAGLAAALGPVVIHLLNRRRYRVVAWAAMDFLREALQRNRRILHLRDLLLLALRTACLLLFGLALARPYFSQKGTAASGGSHPVHAVLLLDNSLSMGYERLGTSLLDEAKSRALEVIERLPASSRISVVPLCGSRLDISSDPYRTADDAREAVRQVELVDRPSSAPHAAELARAACQQAPDLPAKRVILIGDQQALNWPRETGSALGRDLPELQIVQVAAERAENAWISEFRLEDGVADGETPAVFFVRVRYEGPAPRLSVPVTLTIDSSDVASETIDLESGQTREVRFTHQFDQPVEPGRATSIPAIVSLPADQLPADDRRFLAVPVVASLPVVFVDQFGPNEDLARNRHGETFPLRRLFAPITAPGGPARGFAHIRQLTIDQVDRQSLQDARLVVVAGVEHPGAAVSVLREYVLQGGSLFIAAGSEFDPGQWTSQAWLDGAGILPAPLQPRVVGHLPEEAGRRLEVFSLAPETMVADIFHLDESSRQELRDLFLAPVFFQAVVADMADDVLDRAEAQAAEWIGNSRRELAELDSQRRELLARRDRGGVTAADQQQLEHVDRQRQDLLIDWLPWAGPAIPPFAGEEAPADLARRWRPRVLAAYSNGHPFLLERALGRGKIIHCTTGLLPQWNNMAQTDAVLIFDQLLRSCVADSLPQRNFETRDEIVIPLDPALRRADLWLDRPGGERESLAVDILSDERIGVTVRRALERGIYRCTARRTADMGGEVSEGAMWETVLAANGPSQESELQSLSALEVGERLAGVPHRWVAPGQAVSLEGAQVRGQGIWKILLLATLACGLAELVVVAWPHWTRERVA